MTRYRIPEGKDMDMVQQAYAELASVDQLVQGDGDGAEVPRRATAGDLYAFATGDQRHAGTVKQGLLRFPQMRTVLKAMLAEVSVGYLPEVAAAASDEFPERRVDQGVLRVQRSQAEPSQFYLIFEVAEGYEAPTVLIVCDREEQFEQIVLPAPRRGTIQLAVTQASGVPDMLRDPKSAIYLR